MTDADSSTGDAMVRAQRIAEAMQIAQIHDVPVSAQWETDASAYLAGRISLAEFGQRTGSAFHTHSD
ncbi:MAG: hypothetical protein CSA58_12095 [Micrococcales bacterium]|nr:MAG: hypothetical protein CSB46_02490 [Micrococcales bacterium]PIE25951.1 MAG: hypothetical protein CSA58_12095 [Micrococcales bacterium]